MKNIYSNILKPTKKNLIRAKIALEKGNVIGVPTETVYGLAANAYNTAAIKKIYKIKKRPQYNPLIVHYKNIEAIEKDAESNKNFKKLVKKFSPGPITYVLKKKKKSKISPLVSNNLKTIAVRIPNNKIIINILNKINFPIAAPSANKSKSLSPTTAKHVAQEFNNNLNIILNGGKCKIGLESTVIDLTGKPEILREGGLPSETIMKYLKIKFSIKKNKKIKSPGLVGLHYSPGVPIYLNRVKPFPKGALIMFGKNNSSKKNFFNLSNQSNINEAAKKFFNILRIIKNKKYKSICVNKIPNKSLGKAINNRLIRASQY